jgi:hypothetical protein
VLLRQPPLGAHKANGCGQKKKRKCRCLYKDICAYFQGARISIWQLSCSSFCCFTGTTVQILTPCAHCDAAPYETHASLNRRYHLTLDSVTGICP